MVMDPNLRGFPVSLSRFKFNSMPVYYQNLINGFKLDEAFPNHNPMEIPLVPPDPNPIYSNPSTLVSSSSDVPDLDSPEDCDFSDTVLKYISQILMEEDMEEKSFMSQEALQAAEKPFYEILSEKSPPLSDQLPSYSDHSVESPYDTITGNYSNYSSSSSSSSNNALDSNLVCDIGEYKYSQIQNFPTDYSPKSSFNSSTSVVDGLVESPGSIIQVPDLYSESQPIWQFRKGVEEASKFLPIYKNLIFDLENSKGLSPLLPKEEDREIVIKVEKKEDREHSAKGSRGRKNSHPLDINLKEERCNKQIANYHEETLRSEMFDMVLLEEKSGSVMSSLHKTSKNVEQNRQSKGLNGGKSRGRKQSGKREVDLSTLLIHCAQAVATDDRKTANEVLKQIRQNSNDHGDGTQRLAHYFANGLEARLAGTGSQLYTALVTKRAVVTDILKAYHLYVSVCPFQKLSSFYSNQTIMNVAEKATRLHIIDFGIVYGFQWPCLIQRLSARPGGPPKLRITGVAFPQPGFRPTERVEETGRRLANYAESFNVPFEYNAIAQKFETIKIEDLKIDPDEVLIVNCLFAFKNLLDETVVVDSPRNAVLKLIKKANPEVLIHGIMNGAYNAPFFVTRFREALFHYSTMYDILEINAPRESEERVLIEREFFGRESLNVIACEGTERVERPETYKQWQVRYMRAGFKQLPLNQDIMKKARDRVKSSYHKDFVIDKDGGWMLQGWKGRIVYGISSWRSAQEE